LSKAKQKLVVEKLILNRNAVEVFSAIQHLPWSSLLDTCNNTLSDGRFDIIVSDPIITVTAKNGNIKIEHKDGPVSSTNNVKPNAACPFEALDVLLNDFSLSIAFDTANKENESFKHLPFVVGCLGFFGYDLNTQLDNIKNTDITDNTHEYCAHDFAVGIYDQSLIFDNHTGDVFFAHTERSTLLALIEQEPDIAAQVSFRLSEEWKSNVSQAEYCERISTINKYLNAGDCYQVNYAQRFSASYVGSEWQAYKTLRNVNKAPFSAFLRHQDFSILSVSPERFIQVKDRNVETKPIKGTRSRSNDPIEDKRLSDELLSSEKDLAENLMIVDLLRNDLSKHCQPHSVAVPSLFKLESYPAVHHMVSTVVGKIKSDSSPLDLLKGAFPGGSITGAPKVRSMQIIQELEPNKRSIYCGSIGFIGVRGDMDTSICIRTVLAENTSATDNTHKTLYCWAGGGIVLDSQADSEYQESFDKVAKILPVLRNTLKYE